MLAHIMMLHSICRIKFSRIHRKKVFPVVTKMKNEAGHEVLYSPQHYSDFQAIEKIWAIVQGHVGRQYKTETMFKEVIVLLKAAFNNPQPQTVQGRTRKANGKLIKLREYIPQAADMEEPSEEGSSEKNEVNSSSEETESDRDDNYF